MANKWDGQLRLSGVDAVFSMLVLTRIGFCMYDADSKLQAAFRSELVCPCWGIAMLHTLKHFEQRKLEQAFVNNLLSFSNLQPVH